MGTFGHSINNNSNGSFIGVILLCIWVSLRSSWLQWNSQGATGGSVSLLKDTSTCKYERERGSNWATAAPKWDMRCCCGTRLHLGNHQLYIINCIFGWLVLHQHLVHHKPLISKPGGLFWDQLQLTSQGRLSAHAAIHGDWKRGGEIDYHTLLHGHWANVNMLHQVVSDEQENMVCVCVKEGAIVKVMTIMLSI